MRTAKMPNLAHWIVVCGAVVALLVSLVGTSSAAAAEGPVWKITSISAPTNLAPGGGGELVLTAINVGDGATDGSTITIADSLPAGITATRISGTDIYTSGSVLGGESVRIQLECSLASLTCTRTGVVPEGDQLVVRLVVSVAAGAAATVVNSATVSGGGAEAAASVSNPVTISATPAPFGLAQGSVFAAVSSRQAGGHPDGTAGFSVNTITPGAVDGDARDIRFDLSPGLVGNTVGMPRCTQAQIVIDNNDCPSDTLVGVASVTVTGGTLERATGVVPVFNIAPAPGEPAAFMFKVSNLPVRLDTSVLSDGDYGVRIGAGAISQAEPLLSTYVTLWGVPADHEGPGGISLDGYASVGGPSDNSRVPLLSNPTQCSSPLTATAEADSWRNPGVFDAQTVSAGTMEGCTLLPFSASVSMLPDTLQAGAPAGYTFALHVAQNNEPNSVTASDVRRVVTTLPMGTVISPSAAWGLIACSDEQFYGPASERGLERAANPAACPREAQIGTVQVKTPALEEPLVGQVYLATPHCNPCTPADAQGGGMVRLFVQVVSEGEGGIVVKLEGTGSINQQTGQLTFTFDENPQLPFSEFKLMLGGGPRATLANPRTCEPTTTTVDLTAWSAPFTADASPTSVFQPTGCYSPQFNPAFVAGTTNIQAGEYSPFTVSFGRQDADEFLNGIQIQMPPGLLGSLIGVPLCKEPQAAQGTCGPESLIGHTQVLTGPGADPFLVTGGQIYLTEGYKGAPFGLSIVVPAVAGPYTLAGTTGKGTVVVRAAINVDPHTAALTVTSDPLPTALDGIPLQLRVVNVTIDRPRFTFNPTSCAKLQIGATITSKESAGVNVAVPFQATNCAGLSFKPRFLVSTQAHTSKADGASLDAKVIYPSGGGFANIRSVKVDLPKQLPSRLTTLQHACLAAVFEANPANCPAASVVGIARASTPILPVGLNGPAYFVSHGGAALPDLDILLQGYGVRVQLTGATSISKAGITSSTFKQVPDVPINSFELYLPEGKFSALAHPTPGGTGSLCGSKLTMPTEFIAQNGAEIHESTAIAVAGCPKAKKATKAKKSNRGRAASRRDSAKQRSRS
jgi:hypothetical protein